MTLQQYIDQETQEKTVSLWGAKVKFTPRLCTETIGDGQHLISVWTMSERPFYWLLLVDSSLQFTEYEPDVEFEGESLLDLCYAIIASEFGEKLEFVDEETYYEDQNNEGQTYSDFLEAYELSKKYPCIDDSMGGSFESIVNFGNHERTDE